MVDGVHGRVVRVVVAEAAGDVCGKGYLGCQCQAHPAARPRECRPVYMRARGGCSGRRAGTSLCASGLWRRRHAPTRHAPRCSCRLVRRRPPLGLPVPAPATACPRVYAPLYEHAYLVTLLFVPWSSSTLPVRAGVPVPAHAEALARPSSASWRAGRYRYGGPWCGAGSSSCSALRPSHRACRSGAGPREGGRGEGVAAESGKSLLRPPPPASCGAKAAPEPEPEPAFPPRVGGNLFFVGPSTCERASRRGATLPPCIRTARTPVRAPCPARPSARASWAPSAGLLLPGKSRRAAGPVAQPGRRALHHPWPPAGPWPASRCSCTVEAGQPRRAPPAGRRGTTSCMARASPRAAHPPPGR